MKPFMTRWLVTTLAVLVVSRMGVGVYAEGAAPLVVAGLLLGILNAFVRPVLLLLSLPLIFLTMGLFIFVVNAITLVAVAGVVHGFHVAGFGSAIVGSLLISFVSWIFSIFFKGSDGRVRIITHSPQAQTEPPPMKTVQGRVIDEK